VSAVRGGRARLSRTRSSARWTEYRELLELVLARGYRVVSLEDWVRDGASGKPEVLLRHDVDQHPRSALTMAEIEVDLGLRSTWYFRWRTAHPRVIDRLRGQGFSVGLHYETLTRLSLALGTPNGAEIESRLPQARRDLRDEIRLFASLHGPIASVCPHGDSRVPGVNNATLLRGEDPGAYGVEFDGNEAMRGAGLAYWLTDRSSAEGSWKDGVDPRALLDGELSPVLWLTHPNNFASGPSLWLDRALSAALAPAGGAGPIRTGRDEPPAG
jgi:hypothetical protein